MKLNKNDLKEMKCFLEYLSNKTTLKEKKALVTIGGIDSLLIINSVWCLLEENKNIDFILQSLGVTGITTGILIAMIVIYFDMYKENEISKKRINSYHGRI